MYYARVLTGQFNGGDPSMKTPPSRNDPHNPSLHYDSTVDRLFAPTMYVIYYDTQAYPEIHSHFQIIQVSFVLAKVSLILCI